MKQKIVIDKQYIIRHTNTYCGDSHEDCTFRMGYYCELFAHGLNADLNGLSRCEDCLNASKKAENISKKKIRLYKIQESRDANQALYKKAFVTLKQLYEYVLKYDNQWESATKQKLLIDVEEVLNIDEKMHERNVRSTQPKKIITINTD